MSDQPAEPADVTELIALIDRLEPMIGRAGLSEIEIEAGDMTLILRAPAAFAAPAAAAAPVPATPAPGTGVPGRAGRAGVGSAGHRGAAHGRLLPLTVAGRGGLRACRW